MFTNKESFKQEFKQRLVGKTGRQMNEVTEDDVYAALGSMIRERIGQDWAATNRAYTEQGERQVYYFSMEFLIGRLLGNNLLNLGVLEMVREGLGELGWDLEDIEEYEADAGLGNGGLGRLAACFLDSLASLGYAGHGNGIRYKYGLFEQKIIDGHQVELPDYWLQKGNVWEVRRDDKRLNVRFWGNVEVVEKEDGNYTYETKNGEDVWAVPYDVPVVGYENAAVNTLRLWSAESAADPTKGFGGPGGSYYNFLDYKRSVETVSEFLYPDDSQYEGKLLRLKQEYFLCSAGVQSVLRTFDKLGLPYDRLPEKVAIHINDTHPTLVIPELMRILLDEKSFGWQEAWDIVSRVVSYTNHTILSEALETWPEQMVRELLPRLYMIIEEVNRRFCASLLEEYPGDQDRVSRMAIIANGQIKMAHLAIHGSHSVNGVAALHTDILKKREMKDFYELYPERFNNKTNGITHRRWLMHANPDLAGVIEGVIGTGWKTRPDELTQLLKHAGDSVFQDKIRTVKHKNKERLASYIYKKHGMAVDTNSIFDVQVKRLHAYKRQLLSALHIMDMYNRIKENPSLEFTPRTFIFGAKAAPGYYMAKQIIKLINNIADTVNNDPQTKDLLKVFFLENYSVSLAEKIIPAADVSEQISTAGKEASGTGNMKLMMNGALTIGTLDGANVEMYESLGDEGMYLFGLRVEEVEKYYREGGYSAGAIYNSDERVKKVLDQLVHPGPFCHNGQTFDPIYHSLLSHNDEYFVLRDFASYAQTQEQIGLDYLNTKSWTKKAILNIAKSGRFAGDRTINEYATEIWGIKPLSSRSGIPNIR
ncbi:glycogen/starch/alpha-glucan phosphorylase [Saccharibacillus alkalitolerans]|uniref:Alpha-1,4 glucan phosphorylase n=1 Tax=Saccharibacillus alkalitolerans TaxID=2705290 RepID=A0ABX0F8U6_9BACL|nr:glycogen/starch/alpha-glucan phosphorylase [Saccharibacillus alkalitolerans]NGZ76738.1 glycogen/starch/alpha-glucan phosphorylase [Saccharibacillus alkalitolerans]